jgi:hypothetical protein
MAGISYAKTILEHWGAIVDEIDPSDSEQSNFVVSIDASVLLIEEKTKINNPDVLRSDGRLLMLARCTASPGPSFVTTAYLAWFARLPANWHRRP